MTTATVTKTKAASKRKAKAVAIADATLALGRAKEMTIQQVIKFLAEDHKLPSQGGRDFDTYFTRTTTYSQ